MVTESMSTFTKKQRRGGWANWLLILLVIFGSGCCVTQCSSAGPTFCDYCPPGPLPDMDLPANCCDATKCVQSISDGTQNTIEPGIDLTEQVFLDAPEPRFEDPVELDSETLNQPRHYGARRLPPAPVVGR